MEHCGAKYTVHPAAVLVATHFDREGERLGGGTI
jgi:hypothetical protein